MIFDITAAIAALLFIFIVFFLFWKRRPRNLKTDYFEGRWKDLQKKCADRKEWASVVSEADSLLDEALRKSHIAGKSMGERLVKVQRKLSDNDGVWFGHKLRTRLETEPTMKLKEKDVKEALMGIRQALKDLGALPDGQQRNS